MATLRTQHGINILFLFIVHLNHGITKPLQTFSEEQFLQELSDDRGNSQGTHHPTVRSRPPYLGNLHLGFHHPHHHQPSEASENEIYDSDESNLLRTPLDRGPHFDLSASKNITALVGKTAYLNCRVKNIGNKTVSWVRHRDIHLLTVGRFTYTSDQRFQAVHNPQTDDWSLQIRYPQKRDTGVYECQISTTPPVGHSMFLSVVEPITTIVGVPDLYINTGSTVNLTCIVRNSPEPPSTIIWTHNNQVRRRGSISGALVVGGDGIMFRINVGTFSGTRPLVVFFHRPCAYGRLMFSSVMGTIYAPTFMVGFKCQDVKAFVGIVSKRSHRIRIVKDVMKMLR